MVPMMDFEWSKGRRTIVPEHRQAQLAGLRKRWVLAFVLGELIGFLPPAIVGAWLGSAGVSELTLVGGLTAAGLVEGAALGVAQAWVLRRHAPEIDHRAWIVATTVAAGVAWLAGMGGSALLGAGILPPALAAAVAVPAFALGLLAMGVLQWLVLRRAVADCGRWIWVTTGAWLVGVAIPVAALSLAPNFWPPWAFAVVGSVAAVAMGAVVGALTGTTLVRLLGGLSALESLERTVLVSAPADGR